MKHRTVSVTTDSYMIVVIAIESVEWAKSKKGRLPDSGRTGVQPREPIEKGT